MIEVTKKEAKSHVKDKDLVIITWMTEGCPNCKLFEETLDEIHKEQPEWNFYKIEVPFPAVGLIIEPSMYPATFVFKEGERKVVAIGVSPKEEVMETMEAIKNETFKTDEELEMEQLNAFNEQE